MFGVVSGLAAIREEEHKRARNQEHKCVIHLEGLLENRCAKVCVYARCKGNKMEANDSDA